MRQTMTKERENKPRRKTRFQAERDARDLAIYNEWNKLAADPEQSRVEINNYLMMKYRIHSSGTVYQIRKRVEAMLKREEEQK